VHAAIVTQPGGQASNEDWAGVTPELAAVLDGVTVPDESTTGCSHGTAWYVRQLGSRLLTLASDPGHTLPHALADAIRQVAALHPGCDLTQPGTPSAAVALLRAAGDVVEHLVLADTVLLLDTHRGLQVVTDDRLDDVAVAEHEAISRFPIGSPAHHHKVERFVDAKYRARNQAGGYWVAGVEPAAADQALIGSIARQELRRVALLSDGASCLVDRYGLATWTELLDVLDQRPGELIRRIRAAEATDPEGQRWPRYKQSDDATAVYLKRRPEPYIG